MAKKLFGFYFVYIFCLLFSLKADEQTEIKSHLKSTSPLFDTESQEDIESALANWENTSERDLFLASVLDRNLNSEFDPADLEGIDQKALINFSIETNPKAAQQLYKKFVLSLHQTSIDISEKLSTEKKDLITTVNEKMSFRYDRKLREADETAHTALELIAASLKSTDPNGLIQFNSERTHLIQAYNSFLEAKAKRLDSVTDWASEIRSLQEIISAKKYSKSNESELSQRWIQILEKEKNIEVRRAWINRETITTGAIAAVIAAQGICIFVTVGVCAVTLPATAEWYVVAGRVALTGARVGIAGSSLISLIDRYRFNGASGLLNVASALDILMIISTLPGPSIKMLESTKTFQIFGQTISSAEIAVGLSRLKIGAAKSLFKIGVPYGIWQIVRADSIAARLKKEKRIDVNPNDIRREGALHLMMGIFGGVEAYRTHRFQLENSSNYRSYIEAQPGFIRRQLSSFRVLSPFHSIGKIFRGVKTMPENLWLGAKTSAMGIATLGYQVIATGALALLSYSYPDFLMRLKNKALPELKEGESALLLNGFASNDMLYYAFSSNYANRYEIEKYQNKLGGEFFESAPDFFETIEKFAKENGKIKYLKIMAHGVPGRIVPVATQDIMDGSARELIDTEYLEANQNRIQEIARTSLAPDAQIVIVSCLVGGNLDKPVDYRGLIFEEKSGDNFINALGKNLLIQNGSIDSSRRIIMGLDGTLSPALNHLLYDGMNSSQKDLAFKQELKNLVEKEQADYANYIFEKQKTPNYGNIATGMGERLIRMYSQIWALAYKFGINGEGGFFADRHRHDEFIAGNLVSSTGSD